jgi:signal transduction histidine kinase
MSRRAAAVALPLPAATGGGLRVAAGLGGAYLLLALLSLALSRQPGQLANIWYPNAVATAVLLLQPHRRWPALLAAVALANTLANWWWGDPLGHALAFVPGNLVEVALAAALLRRAGLRAAPLQSAPRLLQLLLWGGVLPQLVAATVAALTCGALGMAEPAALWVSWLQSAIIGAAATLPLAVLLLDQPWPTSRATLADARLWMLLPATAAASVLCLEYLPFPFVYVGLPLLAAALWLDLLAAALLAWVLSLTVAVALVSGAFVPPPVTAAWQSAFVYVACAAALVPPQLLAAAIGALRLSNVRLVERTAELRRANDGLQQFVRIASHDLREPLNTIAQFSGLVMQDHGASLPPDGRHWLGLVQGEAQRMRGLLDDVLCYAQVRQQPLPAPVAVALDEVLQQTLQGLAARLRETAATVQAAPLPVVRGHPTLLALLLQNLLSNALKFQPPGQRPVVTVSAEAQDGWVLLTVADNGIGIAAADQGRLFQPFQRLHRRAEHPGTGLGLALCRQIAQAHGGEVQLASAPGQGSRFTVRLPAA